MPEGWKDLSAAEFVETLDSFLSANPSPEPAVLKEIADHAWDLAGRAEVRNGDTDTFMELVGRLLWPLYDHYNEQRRDWLVATLSDKFAADSSAVTTGAFEKASFNWDRNLKAEVPRGEVAGWVEAWMGQNDWSELPANHRASLVKRLEDDLASSKSYSARWTGFLKPSASGTYVLSVETRGVAARVWLNDVLVVDAGAGKLESDPIDLTGGQAYPLKAEFVYDVDEWYKKTKAPKHEKDKYLEHSHFVLFWQSETLARSVVPSNALLPPQGFGAGSNGLKFECFTDQELSDGAQERLVPELALACEVGVAPACGNCELQRTVCESTIGTLLSSAYLSEDKIPELTWVTKELSCYLSTSEAKQLLDAIAENPKSIGALPSMQVYEICKAHEPIGDYGFSGLILAWCRENADVVTQVAPHPVWHWEPGLGSYAIANYWGFAELGALVAKAGKIEDLAPELETPEGGCNLRLACVLSWAHKKARTIEDWIASLDSRLALETLTGDARVPWLFARAYAEELRKPGDPRPFGGRDWVEEALASAESEPVRFRALEELVARLIAALQGTKVRSLLESVGGQFSGTPYEEKTAAWLSKLGLIEEYFSKRQEEAERQAEAAHLAELEKRLEEAQARNDSEAIERFQRRLDALREGL